MTDSVTSIGYGAFSYCDSLAEITINNPDCEIDDNYFTISNGYDYNEGYHFNGIIRGHKNSTAQEYARDHGYKFAVIGEDYEPVTLNVKGDANGDGVLNVRDAAYIAKTLSKGKASELSESADFNGDGSVNVRDAAAIAKYLATGKH